MKAGSTGSNPGGATIKNPGSLALETLLKDIGSASFLLNTIVVGLDAVEKGHEKPDSIDIFWEPSDRKIAARTARKFAVESFIVRAAETLKAYTLAISAFPRFADVRAKWDQDTGIAQKLDNVATNVLGKNEYLIAGGMLLLTWRNQIVHKGTLALPAPKRHLLKKHEQEIAASYRNLSVDDLLLHVEQGRPTLKDVSSLIAMSINLARQLDEKIYACLTKEDVAAWIKHYGIAPTLTKVVRETSPDRLHNSIERVFRTHAPGLYGDYKRLFGDTIPDIA